MRVSLQLNNFAVGKLPTYGGVNENLAENNYSKNNSSNSIDLNKSPNNIAFRAISGVTSPTKEIKDEAHAMQYALGIAGEMVKPPHNGAFFIKTNNYKGDNFDENIHNYIRNNLGTVLKGGIENPDDFPTSLQKIKGLEYFRDSGTYLSYNDTSFGRDFYYALWDVLEEKYNVPDDKRKMPQDKVGYFPYEELVMAEKEYGVARKEGKVQNESRTVALNNLKTYTYALWTLMDIMDFYGCDTSVKSNDKGMADIKGAGQEIVNHWYENNLERMLKGGNAKLQPDMKQRFDAFAYIKKNNGVVGEYIFNGVSNALKEKQPLADDDVRIYLPSKPAFPLDELETVLKEYDLKLYSTLGDTLDEDPNVKRLPIETYYDEYFWYYN